MSAVLTAESANELISTNPATGEEVGRARIATPDEVRDAVSRARDAFADWKRTPFIERRQLVMLLIEK